MSEIVRKMVTAITEQWSEVDIFNQIEDAMYNYVDDDEIEEHGGIHDAYDEVGRGCAESDVIRDCINLLYPDVTDDEYCTISDTLCEIWGISTD